MRQARNIDLLELEMDTLWGRDAYGRLEPYPLAAVALASDGESIRLDPAAPKSLVQQIELQGSFGCHTAARNGDPPPILETIRDLSAYGSTRVTGGPSYVFKRAGTAAPPPARPDFRMFLSTEEVPNELVAARPEKWWTPQEWADLLAGRLGPWAIGMTGHEVAALCHTPVASAKAAEAGVWTHPDQRGQGYASIVTGAWAPVAGRVFETLFYSTTAQNTASQRVAQKLNLRPIGWIWQLRYEPANTSS